MKKRTARYFKLLVFSIYINIFQCISTYSQQDSIFHYLEIASKNNPVLLQKFSEYQAALEKVPQVGSLPDPEFNAGIFLSPMELVMGKQVADLSLMQMFPWFGTLNAARDEMSLMAKAKYETFRDSKLQVFFDVQRNWYELLKNRENIRISEKNMEILRSLERIVIVKFKSTPIGNTNSSGGNVYGNNSSINSSAGSSGSAGMQGMGGNMGNSSGTTTSPPSSSGMQGGSMGTSSGSSSLSDLFIIQIEMNDLENNIALLKNQQNTIAARFNSYLNRSPESLINLPDTLIADSIVLNLSGVSDSMLSNNPMLDMIRFEQQSLEARKEMVTKMGYPMVGLGLNYSIINKNEMVTSPMNGKDMVMPMVSVSIPIYRKKYEAMKKEVDFMKTASQQNFEATVNNLQNEYYEALKMYEDAKRRVNLYMNQGGLAKQSLDIMTRSFSTSGSGLTDILQIRRQTNDYEFKQMEAVADLNISIAWLKRLGSI